MGVSKFSIFVISLTLTQLKSIFVLHNKLEISLWSGKKSNKWKVYVMTQRMSAMRKLQIDRTMRWRPNKWYTIS